MIKLNIWQFGGRGGGSGGAGGGGGAGKGSKDGGVSQTMGSRGSAGGMHSGYGSPNKPNNISAGRILKEDDISSKESYTLYRIVETKDGGQREVEYKTKPGAELREDIAYERLDFNRKEKVWVSKKGNKYAIRKK